jgi:uncharacterized protein YodC (DUF2158 family)
MPEPGDFKLGDVVQLKSGGPAMTVSERVAADTVRCIWFDGATARNEVFPVAALQRFEGPKPAAGFRRS